MLWLPTMEALDNPWKGFYHVTREVHETTDNDIENTQDFHSVDRDHFEEVHTTIQLD